eukprot:1541161-Alexandrium_andersonii.AAC.1
MSGRRTSTSRRRAGGAETQPRSPERPTAMWRHAVRRGCRVAIGSLWHRRRRGAQRRWARCTQRA